MEPKPTGERSEEIQAGAGAPPRDLRIASPAAYGVSNSASTLTSGSGWTLTGPVNG